MTRIKNSLCLLATFFLSVLLAGCSGTPIEVVDASLVGAWHGQCKIGLPVVFNPNQIPENVERTYTTVDLDITIHEDASVEGTLGEATLEECVLKLNRGDLGRALNMASDYIITDGYLSGPIVSGEDAEERKEFTIPFDLVDGHIQSWLMWLQTPKYPYPLCQLDLERSSQGNRRSAGKWPGRGISSCLLRSKEHRQHRGECFHKTLQSVPYSFVFAAGLCLERLPVLASAHNPKA